VRHIYGNAGLCGQQLQPGSGPLLLTGDFVQLLKNVVLFSVADEAVGFGRVRTNEEKEDTPDQAYNAENVENRGPAAVEAVNAQVAS